MQFAVIRAMTYLHNENRGKRGRFMQRMNKKRKAAFWVFVVIEVVSCQSIRKPFECYSDICNMYDQDQFCSERETKCRDCLDIIDGCFEPELPVNCTQTCIEFNVQKEMARKRDSFCPVFTPIQNGNRNSSSSEIYKPGDVIEIICNDGYRVSGRSTLQCKAYGQWSHDFPTCEKIVCPVLPVVVNGTHNGSTNQPGDVVTVQCNTGYQRIGPEFTECKIYGVWNNRLSICQKLPELPQILNGKFSRAMLDNGIQSDIIHVTCDIGYTLVGSDSLRWSMAGHLTSENGHLPVCKEEYAVNGWMIVSIIELVAIVCLGCYIVCKLRSGHKNKDKYKTVVQGLNESEVSKNEDETNVLIDVDEENISKRKNDDVGLIKDISLHEQKLHREATPLLSGLKDPPPERTTTEDISPYSIDRIGTQTSTSNAKLDPPDMPNFSHSVPKGVPKKHKEAAPVADIPSSTTFNCSGKADDKTHFNVNISINNSSSADNQSVVGSGGDAMPENKSKQRKTDRQHADFILDKLSKPVEESATSQTSQPEAPSYPETKAVFTGAFAENGMFASNGLAVQQSTNNEQDLGLKLALPNGNLNTDDLV